jgi:serine/threonine-protein kinase RsbW
MIAITESVNNAIVHGNASDKSKNVSLSLQVTDNSLTFTVEDQGNGFNYENLEDPTSPENIEKIGGRGIFLMKHLCDSVTFHDDGKKVELSFYID